AKEVTLMHSYLRGHPALIEAVRRLEHLNPDKFELYYSKRAATRIECKDQQVDSLNRAEDVGLAVRVLKEGRMGFSFTTSLDTPAIERAVEAAFQIAAHLPADPHNDLFAFGEAVYPDVDALDPKGLAEPVERKIELARRLEAACRSADERITGIRSASLSETLYETHLVD